MRRLFRWGACLAIALPLLALSASAGTGPAAGSSRMATPRTLVTANHAIRSFAQSENAVAWIDWRDHVYVKRLSKSTRFFVGSALGNGNRATLKYTPLLTLVGTRAFWTTYDGGNSVEVAIYVSAPGKKRSLVDVLGSDPDGSGTGDYPAGIVGDGTRLVYGFASINVPGGGWPTDCVQLALGDRGVKAIAGSPYDSNHSVRLPAMPSVMMLDASQGLIAVVPASWQVPPGDRCAWIAVGENGPVQVYAVRSTAAKLLSSVAPHGYVKAIALSSTQLAVLIQRANGPRLIERYNPKDGTIIGTTPVSSSTAFELGISSAGIVYRVGTKILFVGPSGVPKLVWNARARPIGLSIEGRRIAWAENVKGRGRIVALTLR
jgi:hypothetical protein